MPYLAVVLTPESQALLQPLAIYPVRGGDHVTLAYPGQNTDFSSFDPDWLLGYGLGDGVAMDTVGWVADGQVQAVKVEIRGSSLRTWDGGILHITLSRQPEAKSVESNILLATCSLEHSLHLRLYGTVSWQF